MRARGAQLACPVALFFLNAFVTLRLFHSQYIAQMGSIEGAFIGLARYIHDHFPHLNWMPLWYGGIPFPDSYPPLLHVTVAAVSALAHLSAGLAYHAVTAVFYSLAPVALYWALLRLGARAGLHAWPQPDTRSSRPPSGWSARSAGTLVAGSRLAGLTPW